MSSTHQSKTSSQPSIAAETAEFEAYYLQRATREFAEDLDKVRSADDFKNDAVPMLVHALKQGAGMFSPADQRRIVAGGGSGKGESRS